MNFFNKIFPGSENKIRYDADRGDNKPISEGRSVPIIYYEDAPVSAVEQSSVETRDVLEKMLGYYVLENNEYREQLESFKEAFKDVGMSNVETEEVNSIKSEMKRVFKILKNENKLVANSSEKKDIRKAIAERILKEIKLKEETQGLLTVLIEQVLADTTDEYDKKTEPNDNNVEINNTNRMEFIEPGQNNEILVETTAENPIVNALDTTLSEKDISKVASTTGMEEEKKKESDVQNVSKAPNKDVRSKKEKKETLLDYRLGIVAKALEKWIAIVEKLSAEKGDELKSLSYYVNQVANPKKDRIVGEDLEKLNAEIENTKKTITEVWKMKKNEYDEFEKKKKPLVESVETKAEDEKNENERIAQQFREAAMLIEKSDLSLEEYEKEFGVSLSKKIVDEDLVLSLLKCADIIDGHHEDSVTQAQKDEFWKQYDNRKKIVDKLNNPKNPNKLVVVGDATYIVSKSIERDENTITIGTEIERKNEKDPKEVFELSLELAKKFKDKLAEALRENEEYKKLRVEYQESFLEGHVVVFLNELLEQERVIVDDKKENFIENILEKLFPMKANGKSESLKSVDGSKQSEVKESDIVNAVFNDLVAGVNMDGASPRLIENVKADINVVLDDTFLYDNRDSRIYAIAEIRANLREEVLNALKAPTLSISKEDMEIAEKIVDKYIP